MSVETAAELRSSSVTTRKQKAAPGSKDSKRTVLVWVLRISVFVVFIGLWSIAVIQGWLDIFYVSAPNLIWDALVNYFTSGAVWAHGLVTLQATFAGFAVGAGLGIGVGMLFALVPLLDSVFSPYLNAFNAMPRVALAPLFILWFGIGITSKIWFSVSLVFFIVLINTQAGIKGVDRELTTTAASMGATKQQIFLKVILPGSIPTIFAGLRLGLVYALLGVVFGEMLASAAGLGQQITAFAGRYDMSGVMATLIILAAISLTLNYVLALVEKRLLRWQ